MVWSKTLLNGKDLFQRGITYEEFIGRYDERQKARFDGAYEKAHFGEDDLQWFRRLKEERGPIATLVIAENWCGDCIMCVAALGKLQEATGAFDLRFLYRDDPAIAQEVERYFLTWGRKKIPVFVFLDEEGREIGRYASRPYTQEMAGLQGDHEKVKTLYQDGSYCRELAAELKAALA
ncbi:MAG: thioredoxin family protein [Clostridiales bacterium]|nr:thioredoxin family protein [Clostridiales bacterium]